MLGAFLWGRKAECELIDYSESQQRVELTASHNGYAPVIHTRTYEFDGHAELSITDRINNTTDNNKIQINYILAPNCQVKIEGKEIDIRAGLVNVKMIIDNSDAKIGIKDFQYSATYGEQIVTRGIVIEASTDDIVVKMIIE